MGKPSGALQTFPAVGNALAINDRGVILTLFGALIDADGAQRHLGQPGICASGVDELRTYALNSAGAVVGKTWCDELGLLAWLWRAGQWTDLTQALGDPQWVLRVAVSVNDRGQILGSGEHNGAYRAFLLTPRAPGWLAKR